MNRRGHNYFTKLMFPGLNDRLVNAVNRELDAPSAYLGPGHRVANHDPFSACEVGIKVAKRLGFPESDGVLVAQAHLLEDYTSDQLVKMRTVIGNKSVSAKKIFDLVF